MMGEPNSLLALSHYREELELQRCHEIGNNPHGKSHLPVTLQGGTCGPRGLHLLYRRFWLGMSFLREENSKGIKISFVNYNAIQPGFSKDFCYSSNSALWEDTIVLVGPPKMDGAGNAS